MLDEVGFFDDDFFLIYEDADLNFRAQLAGWRSLFVPGAVVHHKVSAGLQRLGEAAVVHAVRNEKAVIIKNAPIALMLKHLPVFLLEELVFSVLHHILARRFRSYLKGNYEFLINLPRYLEKRKQVVALRKVPSNYIEAMLTSVFPIYRDKFKNRLKALFGPGRLKET
jgi:GT2 family glycosyltransferase